MGGIEVNCWSVKLLCVSRFKVMAYSSPCRINTDSSSFFTSGGGWTWYSSVTPLLLEFIDLVNDSLIEIGRGSIEEQIILTGNQGFRQDSSQGLSENKHRGELDQSK